MEPGREDQIKEAFHKVRIDMDFLGREILELKESLIKTREEMVKILEIMSKLIPAQKLLKQTIPAHNPAHPAHFNKENKSFSTGNEGVPADRQTDRQTDNTPPNTLITPFFSRKEDGKSQMKDAAKILDSLDSLKKEIRIKFKQLTDQEILVFSAIYQLEEERGPVDYKTLAQKLELTESSIRDYIGRLLKKGIPVEKKRINNKQIQLGISQSLKKIASLSTILQLRDI